MIPFRTESGVQQEADDVAERPVMNVGIVGMVVVLGAIVVAAAMLRAQWGDLRDGRAARTFGGHRAPEEIGIVDQTLIGIQNTGLRQRARQREYLERYGWVDRVHGIARIPIERAMDIVADHASEAEPGPANTGAR